MGVCAGLAPHGDLGRKRFVSVVLSAGRWRIDLRADRGCIGRERGRDHDRSHDLHRRPGQADRSRARRLPGGRLRRRSCGCGAASRPCCGPTPSRTISSIRRADRPVAPARRPPPCVGRRAGRGHRRRPLQAARSDRRGGDGHGLDGRAARAGQAAGRPQADQAGHGLQGPSWPGSRPSGRRWR